MLELNFNPFPGFETERLLLNRVECNSINIEAILKLRSNGDAMHYIGKPLATNKADAEDLIMRMANDLENNTGIGWGIWYKHTNTLIGTIGYHRIQKENHRAEIGYMILPKYWNQGIMSEAMKMILKHGFDTLQFHRIEAVIDPRNESSAAILKKFGFVKEAHLRENYFFNDTFLDSEIYALLKVDFNFSNNK